MAEIRGCDLVVEYLIKEKVPYMFGYAGHGAVGLLDGVYNHQDEIKIIFPRIESAAGYMADAYFRASGQLIPVYTSTGPGPMLLTVAMGNAFYDSSAFIAITGQVATNQYDSGALQEEYRHHQADFPSMAKVITKRSYQAQSVDDLGKFLPKAFKLHTELVAVLVLTAGQLRAVVADRPKGFGDQPGKYHGDAIFLMGIDAVSFMVIAPFLGTSPRRAPRASSWSPNCGSSSTDRAGCP